MADRLKIWTLEDEYAAPEVFDKVKAKCELVVPSLDLLVDLVCLLVP